CARRGWLYAMDYW
nr:immunoglobulin heavy chain junction region [Mus musculus]